jgi:hypothetical protein
MNQLIITLTLAVAFVAPLFAQSGSTAPAPFEKLNKKQLQSLIVNARTPADHQRIADFYHAKAQSLLAESSEHAAMAARYKANPVIAHGKFAFGTVDHCEYLSQSLKQEGGKNEQLANLHYEMAHSSLR